MPPGAYRIQVNAAGFLPYESNTLQVLATPVTLNVPLERSVGTVRQVNVVVPPPAQTKVYLPQVAR